MGKRNAATALDHQTVHTLAAMSSHHSLPAFPLPTSTTSTASPMSIAPAPAVSSSPPHSGAAHESHGAGSVSGRESSSSPVQSSTMSADRKQRKNFREKQRRNELNEHFDALCVLLNLNSKVEKSNCLAEAISTIEKLRQRTTELEQENQGLRTGADARVASSVSTGIETLMAQSRIASAPTVPRPPVTKPAISSVAASVSSTSSSRSGGSSVVMSPIFTKPGVSTPIVSMAQHSPFDVVASLMRPSDLKHTRVSSLDVPMPGINLPTHSRTGSGQSVGGFSSGHHSRSNSNELKFSAFTSLLQSRLSSTLPGIPSLPSSSPAIDSNPRFSPPAPVMSRSAPTPDTD